MWSGLSSYFAWEGDCGRTYYNLVAEDVDNLGDIYGVKGIPFITLLLTQTTCSEFHN